MFVFWAGVQLGRNDRGGEQEGKGAAPITPEPGTAWTPSQGLPCPLFFAFILFVKLDFGSALWSTDGILDCDNTVLGRKHPQNQGWIPCSNSISVESIKMI